MNAHELIDRLAALDEAAAPVEEPVTEPGIEEPQIEPDAPPAPRRGGSPYELPPDFEPGQMPRPKAESEAIDKWLQATQQPIQDWEWDGQHLRLLMDDGSTEVYSRRQLEQTGVFDQGELAFAESKHPIGEAEDDEKNEPVTDNTEGLPPMPDDDQEINDVAAGEASPAEAAGTLDMILGRTAVSAGPPLPSEPEVINIEGDKAEQLAQAVGDVVQAILGIVSDDDTVEKSGPGPDDSEKDDKKDKDNDKNEKADDKEEEEEENDDKDDE